MNGVQPPRWYICLLKTQQTQKTASLNVSIWTWMVCCQQKWRIALLKNQENSNLVSIWTWMVCCQQKWRTSLLKTQENSNPCEYLNMNGLRPTKWRISLLKTLEKQQPLWVSEHEWFAAHKMAYIFSEDWGENCKVLWSGSMLIQLVSPSISPRGNAKYCQLKSGVTGELFCSFSLQWEVRSSVLLRRGKIHTLKERALLQ